MIVTSPAFLALLHNTNKNTTHALSRRGRKGQIIIITITTVCPYVCNIFTTTRRILMRFILIEIMIQEKGLYVYSMHCVVEKHISITPVRSQGGSLVIK
jgi:hypothetical protein